MKFQETHLFEGDSKASDGVVVGTTLGSRENSPVDLIFKIVFYL